MTRTYLMQLAQEIRDHPLATYPSPNYKGIVYEGSYHSKPIRCFYDLEDYLICVQRNGVLYLVRNTGNTELNRDVREFYRDQCCHTKVYLYPNSHRLLFIDEQGGFGSDASIGKSYACDYKDVIPLPQRL